MIRISLDEINSIIGGILFVPAKKEPLHKAPLEDQNLP